MPIQVPRYRGGQVPEPKLPTVRQRVQTTPQALGSDIAGVLPEVGKALFTREKKKQDTAVLYDARKDLSEFEQQSRYDLNQEHGAKVIDKRKEIMDGFDARYREIRAALPTMEARIEFDKSATKRRESLSGASMSYAMDRREQSAKEDTAAVRDNAIATAALASAQGDILDVLNQHELGKQAVVDYEETYERDPAPAVEEYNTKFHTTVVDAMDVAGRPDHAEKYLEKYGDQMNADVRNKLSMHIQNRSERKRAKTKVAELWEESKLQRDSKGGLLTPQGDYDAARDKLLDADIGEDDRELYLKQLDAHRKAEINAGLESDKEYRAQLEEGYALRNERGTTEDSVPYRRMTARGQAEWLMFLMAEDRKNSKEGRDRQREIDSTLMLMYNNLPLSGVQGQDQSTINLSAGMFANLSAEGQLTLGSRQKSLNRNLSKDNGVSARAFDHRIETVTLGMLKRKSLKKVDIPFIRAQMRGEYSTWLDSPPGPDKVEGQREPSERVVQGWILKHTAAGKDPDEYPLWPLALTGSTLVSGARGNDALRINLAPEENIKEWRANGVTEDVIKASAEANGIPYTPPEEGAAVPVARPPADNERVTVEFQVTPGIWSNRGTILRSNLDSYKSTYKTNMRVVEE